MILDGLLIFFLRIVDMSLSTLRFMMVVRGRRLLAWVFAFGGSLVFLFAIRGVLENVQDWARIIGYAAGFSTGVLVGMRLEESMAIGFTRLQIVSTSCGGGIAQRLREHGFAVTDIPGKGRGGAVNVLTCSMARKKAEEAEQIIREVDPQAFVISQDMRPLQHGFWLD